MIWFVLLYLLCGMFYTLIGVWNMGEWDWDIGEGWFPWYIAYPAAILFWWVWLIRRR